MHITSETTYFSDLCKNEKTQNRLKILLNRFMDSLDAESIYEFMDGGKKDKEILDFIHDTRKIVVLKKEDGRYNKNKIMLLLSFLRNNSLLNIANYLDIGSGAGGLTVDVGEAFGLDPKHIYGIDVSEFAGMTFTPSGKFNSSVYDGKNIPFPDNKFELISMMMVLHHVKKDDKTKLLKEIMRVLKKGGHLLLREHDNFDGLEALIVLEHYLFNIFYDETYMTNGYSSENDVYYTKEELVKYITSFGFKYIPIKYNFDGTRNPTNYYYILFKKN